MKYIATLAYLMISINSYSFSAYASEPNLTQKLNEMSKRSGSKAPSNVKKVMKASAKKLERSGIAQSAVNQGEALPEFSIAGKPFKSFYSKKPVVLKFYRGHWCPYCQVELKEYQKYKEEIEKAGYQLIVLTPDSKKYIDKFKKKQKVTIDIYQDKDNAIAKKFGIAFKLDKELQPIYMQFGIDLTKSQGNNQNELPLPGTYVINKDGTIKYAFIDSDYKKRLDPQDLLNIIR
ncbi:MAG: AhpC/TSA family protein [Oligoflexia bacterium]|nr:AhpC/TSA family protein [Oligoflexia bacterium]